MTQNPRCNRGHEVRDKVAEAADKPIAQITHADEQQNEANVSRATIRYGLTWMAVLVPTKTRMPASVQSQETSHGQNVRDRNVEAANKTKPGTDHEHEHEEHDKADEPTSSVTYTNGHATSVSHVPDASMRRPMPPRRLLTQEPS